jgi:diguanylate cyclase (GGDEF)-like protein
MSKPAPGALGETDRLTSLRNQGAYEQDLEAIEAGSLKLATPAACVRMDVDDFKKVNDGYGHPAGDAALKHIAAIIRQKCRPRDKIYRISGDEFGVIMPDTSEDEAFGVMRRILGALKAADVIWTSKDGESRAFPVSLSIGVAECEQASSIKAVFQAADGASYASKKAGKAQATKAPSMTQPE